MPTIEERLSDLERLFVKREDGQMSLNIQGGVKLTNGENMTQIFSEVKGSKTFTIPDAQGRAVVSNIIMLDSEPTGNEIPNGTWAICKIRRTGEIKLWANDNGKMKFIKFT